jgi:hypothetical protein
MFKIDHYLPKKVYKRNQKNYIFDAIRKKLILQTPEEEIRQGFVQYLINEKGVPTDMIGIEVPMSYFDLKAKGRADIIVYAVKDDKRVPIMVVECKSYNTSLIDDVFDQVYDYEDILYSNTIAVTNGKELYVETWNESSASYHPLEELPNYVDLVSANNYKYDNREPFFYKRRRFEDFTKKENIEAYQGHFYNDTDPKLYTFIMNLNELLWDDAVKIPYNELFGIKFIEDLGIRYTKFGNAAGYDWTGEYRSIIVEDKRGSHQIVSLAILEGYLIVAIDNDKYSHNSLQLSIRKYGHVHGDYVMVEHNGRLTVGKSGMAKFKEVIDFIENKDSRLLNKDRKIELGLLDNSRQFDWEKEDVMNFIGRLIKYALIRDEFREHKRKKLKKRTGNKVGI